MIRVAIRHELAEALEPFRRAGRRLGLVPTMGYLHEGHLSLVKLAKSKADLVAASIFVNPLQFGPGEDLDVYPRDLERDVKLLKSQGVDLVFHPLAAEMYPLGDPLVTVDPGSLGEVLCGAYRPGHFRGVLTVVARLFGLFRPQVAVFGQKDYQQAILIRRMVRDLSQGVDVMMGPVVREPDGLALSSRNVYLSPQEREDAVGIHRGLLMVQGAFGQGESSPAVLMKLFREELARHPSLRIQYGQIVHPETLDPVEKVVSGSVLVTAAFCGKTRLIDNHILTG